MTSPYSPCSPPSLVGASWCPRKRPMLVSFAYCRRRDSFLFNVFPTVRRLSCYTADRYRTGYKIQDWGRDRTKIMKWARTTRPEDTRRTTMDDETLVSSWRSPQISPPSTTMCPKMAFTGGMTLGMGRRRPLCNLVDMVANLRHSNDHHAGSSSLLVS